MPSKIIKVWDEKPSRISKFGEKLSNYKLPIKDSISRTVYRLKIQKRKLEDQALKIQSYNKELVDRCVNAQIYHDTARAAMYANECAEVRKIAKLTLASQLALEQAILRLETIRQFNDIASAMNPIPQVIKSIKTQLVGIMPEASYELNDLCNMLDDIALQTGEELTATNPQADSEEASRILQEANVIAEHKIGEMFPEISAQTFKVEQPESVSTRRGVEVEG